MPEEQIAEIIRTIVRSVAGVVAVWIMCKTAIVISRILERRLGKIEKED